MAGPEGLKDLWDTFGRAYQSSVDISTDDVHYGPVSAGERELNLLGDVAGKRALEIGCGGGQNSIALARRGAVVEGVDFAPSQILFARALAKSLRVNVTFRESDIQRLDYPPASWDIVLSCFALEYVDNPNTLFQSIARWLKPGGLFCLADLHPFVSSTNVVGARWQSVCESMKYFERGPRQFAWRVQSGASANLWRFHRTLGDIVRGLLGAGLTVVDLLEPELLDSTTSSFEADYPYHDGTVVSQVDVWSRLPYTLIIVARI